VHSQIERYAGPLKPSARELAPIRRYLLLSIGCALLVGCWYLWYATVFKPRRALEQLLAGDHGIQIESIVLTGPGERIVIDDPADAKYFTAAFRSAKRGPPKLGLSFAAQVHLTSGGSAKCYIYLPNEEGFITVSQPVTGIVDDPLTYYRVDLPEPVPEPLAKLLRDDP